MKITENEVGILQRFGHHPDPAVDFCVEVDAIQGLAADVEVGLARKRELEKRIAKAISFRVGGDQQAVAAKQVLRDLAGRFCLDGIEKE